MRDHEAREVFVGEAVDAGTETLLDGVNRTFRFAHETVGGDDIEGNRAQGLTEVFKFTVAVVASDSFVSYSVGTGDRVALGERHGA
jgi:hypothetical protein